MTFETLNPPATRERMDAGAWIYVDVRTVEEFDQGHVPGVWNVPFAFSDPSGGMVPNADFVEVMKRHFTFDSHLVLGWASIQGLQMPRTFLPGSPSVSSSEGKKSRCSTSVRRSMRSRTPARTAELDLKLLASP